MHTHCPMKLLQGILGGLLAWAEDCPCHSRLLSGKLGPLGLVLPTLKQTTSGPRQAWFKALVGKLLRHLDCPCRGLHGPEFAAGAVEEVLDKLTTLSYCELWRVLLTDGEPATEQGLARALEDFVAGNVFLVKEMLLKLILVSVALVDCWFGPP